MSNQIDITNKIHSSTVNTKQFTNDSGNSVTFHRLTISIQINGKPFDIETKLDKRDYAMHLSTTLYLLGA